MLTTDKPSVRTTACASHRDPDLPAFTNMKVPYLGDLTPFLEQNRIIAIILILIMLRFIRLCVIASGKHEEEIGDFVSTSVNVMDWAPRTRRARVGGCWHVVGGSRVPGLQDATGGRLGRIELPLSETLQVRTGLSPGFKGEFIHSDRGSPVTLTHLHGR